MTNELYEKHCWALVDLDAMQSNLALIQKTVGAPVGCVVKADAYGHGAAVVGPWLEENGANLQDSDLRDCTITGCMIYCEPDNAKTTVMEYIEKKM